MGEGSDQLEIQMPSGDSDTENDSDNTEPDAPNTASGNGQPEPFDWEDQRFQKQLDNYPRATGAIRQDVYGPDPKREDAPSTPVPTSSSVGSPKSKQPTPTSTKGLSPYGKHAAGILPDESTRNLEAMNAESKKSHEQIQLDGLRANLILKAGESGGVTAYLRDHPDEEESFRRANLI